MGSIERELCRWSERRLPREMYIKLFIVHFTVIGAYAHLMHLRREPRYVFSLLLMLACPIAGVVLLVWPLIALLVQIIICRSDRTFLNQSIGILIGRVVKDEDTDIQEAAIHWPPEISLKLIRRVIPQLALLAQCTTSIWLFSRRVQHGSDALYDHRIFQLAILGLSTSTMSILHIILRPQYLPPRFWHNYPTKVTWLVSMRPIFTSKHGGSPETQGIPLTSNPSRLPETQRILEVPQLLIDWIYACIVLSVAQALGLELDRQLSNSEIWFRMLDFESHLYYFFPLLMLVAIYFRNVLLHQSRRPLRWRAFAFSGTLVASAVIIPLFICISLLSLEFLFRPVQSGLQIETLLGRPWDFQKYPTAVYEQSQYPNLRTNSTIEDQWVWAFQDIFPDWRRIWTYGHIPASFPCPQAWKDSAADYVWWLA